MDADPNRSAVDHRRLDREEQARREKAAQMWLTSRSSREQKRLRNHLQLLLRETAKLTRLAEKYGALVFEGAGARKQDRVLYRQSLLQQELQEMIGAADQQLTRGSSESAALMAALESWYSRLNRR